MLKAHARAARSRLLVSLTNDQRSTLERWRRARTSPQRVVLRSAIVLLADQGLPTAAIAKRLGISRSTVRLWCQRFGADGAEVLLRDAPGRGRKPRIAAGAIAKAVKDAGTRASIRQLARCLGTSPSTVHRALMAQRTDGQFRNDDDDTGAE